MVWLVCGVWRVVCGVWCVVCGVWCVVCGVWCVVCGVCCGVVWRAAVFFKLLLIDRLRNAAELVSLFSLSFLLFLFVWLPFLLLDYRRTSPDEGKER